MPLPPQLQHAPLTVGMLIAIGLPLRQRRNMHSIFMLHWLTALAATDKAQWLYRKPRLATGTSELADVR